MEKDTTKKHRRATSGILLRKNVPTFIDNCMDCPGQCCELTESDSTIEGVMKKCGGCKKHKPIDSFYKDRSRLDGLTYLCKKCDSAKGKISHKSRMQNAHYREWKKLNEHKIKAYAVLRVARKDGKVIKEPCWLCGNTEAEAHHIHYEFPLKLIWLCKQHHADVESKHKITLRIGEYESNLSAQKEEVGEKINTALYKEGFEDPQNDYEHGFEDGMRKSQQVVSSITSNKENK